MKLAELGLKTKPATKYVQGGYVSFSTSGKELFYKTIHVTKTNQSTLSGGMIKTKTQLDQILKAKTIQEVIWT